VLRDIILPMFTKVDPAIVFPEMEKKWLRTWYESGTIEKYLHKNDAAKETFSFQDGPITANNPMGVHHAWGRSYKDLWQKFHNLLGYRERFQNGFDCQGLWVEVEVEKELGLRRKGEIENLVPGDRKKSIARFVELCKARVYKFSAIQTEQSKRLGYFMDWDHSYYTMSDENNYMIWHFLKVAHENGWIYKGHESVPWCPRCETAISQHEMLTEDYKEVVHESIYFELPIVNRHHEFLLVWTTTPWTLPANIAVAVDEKLEYALVEGQKGMRFWVAKDSVDVVFVGDKKIIKTVLGKELVGLKYRGPFDQLDAVSRVAKENPNTFHTVVATDKRILPISITEGTGLVHTAVSAGVEDFKLGKKLGLPMIPVIGDNADYLPGLGEFSGKNAKKNPRIILDYLEEHEEKDGGWVFLIHKYKHRYPACWRCKTELVWKVADEWYIAMDRPSRKMTNSKMSNETLRQRMMKVAKKITWIPSFGLERELDWLKNMHDWLISKKNRYWGLALPIYECKKCGQIEVIGSKKELQSRAVSGWEQFEGKTPHKPYIDEVTIKCAKCGEEVKRIDDVGNPWLDAGIVPYSTMTEHNQGEPLYLTDKNKWKKWFPADFITESFPGQFKNWFYAMIAESTVLENTNSFKTVLGFATSLGEDGRPMHKSWGNSIEFTEGADKIGVDVMRWMFARQNPSENMLFGYKKADEVRRQFYLLLWNIYKFFVEYANLEEVTPEELDKTSVESPNVLDQWIVSRFNSLVKLSEDSLKSFNAKEMADKTEAFVNELSTWYVRRSRERLWVNSEDRNDKLHFYKTTHHILVNLSIMLSPIMPFITEEIYVNLTGSESVHLSRWPEYQTEFVNVQLETEMALARKITELGHSLRKDAKIKIKQPLMNAWHSEPGQKIKNVNILHQILKELNVKKWFVEDSQDLKKKNVIRKDNEEGYVVWLDSEINDELRHEGNLRDLIRSIQKLRKEQGVQSEDQINLVIPSDFEKDIEFIKKRVQANNVTVGPELMVSI